jgi:hypothetical protein
LVFKTCARAYRIADLACVGVYGSSRLVDYDSQ